MSTTLFTVQQTADKLGITRQAVQQAIREGRLRAIWMLERWAVPGSEIRRYRAVTNAERRKAA